MKVSREQVAENRQCILEAASRLFRERGFDAVTVAEVMKAAGLTHGGFYGYFGSKDDLIAETLTHVLEQGGERAIDPAAFAAAYLTPAHRDDLAGGCPTAGLAGETIRQSPQARAAMTEGLRRTIERLSEGMPDMTAAQARRAAIGSWAAMVGAVVLARLADDPKLSDEVLKQTHAWIREKKPDAGAH
ncbi:TetR/AcrR family transcriptional regulator [Paraburkholderia phosphatilytica]|uniref:TetR/AcrR family transcriptional regulator n=1 Tax=Paraburkholderia phosphatilytica TaxID=2282883 RepID=UPI000E4C97DA|nr:TetR/AcrR family transcriptional regulator [Paraburkholderia phosphatilytica]